MKNFTFFLLSMLSVTVVAQVPNNSFENWTAVTVDTVTFDVPDYWMTSNSDLAAQFAVTNVTKETTGAQDGANAVKLKTITLPGTPAIASGAISSGNITYDGVNYSLIFDGGFPYTSRPGGLAGYMKYTPAGTDSSNIWVLLTKWNTSNNSRDTIAYASSWNNSTLAAWTSFYMPLTYLSTDDPDTALIVALSTKRIVVLFGGTPGSTLLLDNLSFEGGVGIQNINDASSINLFPNPAVDRLIINAADNYNNALIFDMTGRLVNEVSVIGNSVDVSALNKGQYVLELKNENGVARSTFAKQ